MSSVLLDFQEILFSLKIFCDRSLVLTMCGSYFVRVHLHREALRSKVMSIAKQSVAVSSLTVHLQQLSQSQWTEITLCFVFDVRSF